MQSYPIKKSFLSTPKLQLPTAPKLTCNSPFRIPLATVSLQYNNPFFENSQSCVSTKVTPFAPIQILTGDTREGCAFRRGRLHNDGRSFQRKSRIERRFESLPGVQRFANLWGTFGSFRTSEKNKSVLPCREIRGFPNLESAHPKQRPRTNKIKFF